MAFDLTVNDQLPPLSKDAVEALMHFIPIFEVPSFLPGVERGGQDDGSGVVEWPWFDYGPEVREFEGVLYRDGWIVGFNWGAWQDEGRALVEGNGIESAGLDDLRRLLTVIFRKERFCDGTIAVAFRDGTMRRVLRRISDLASESRKERT